MRARIFVRDDIDGRRLLVENRNGGCDWPIRYHDGRLAFDYPELVSKWIRPELHRRFDAAIKKGKRFDNDAKDLPITDEVMSMREAEQEQ